MAGGEVTAGEKVAEDGNLTERLKDPLGMLLVQLITTGMILLSKLVLNEGHSIFVILTYRCVVGALFVLPLTLLKERGKWRELNFRAALWIFINAILGITGSLGLYYSGLRDTNATFAASILNIVPVLTFLSAVVVRLERLGLDSRGGRIKIIGTVMCVGGAMVSCIYNGVTIHISSPAWGVNNHKHSLEVFSHHKIRGILFLISSCFCCSAWSIVQAKLLQKYPYKYCVTMYTCIVASFQSAILGLLLNANRKEWILHLDLRLLLILYSGALNTGVVFCLISWVVPRKGPSYSTMFNVVSLILTTVLEAIFLIGNITVGSLMGITLIIGGLYAHLWGRAHELPPNQIRDEESIVTIQNQDQVHCNLDVHNVKAVHLHNPR